MVEAHMVTHREVDNNLANYLVCLKVGAISIIETTHLANIMDHILLLLPK